MSGSWRSMATGVCAGAISVVVLQRAIKYFTNLKQAKPVKTAVKTLKDEEKRLSQVWESSDVSQPEGSISPSYGLQMRKSPSEEALNEKHYHTLRFSDMRDTAVVVIDAQPAYWDDAPASKLFPNVPAAISELLTTARQVLSPPQIVHIRANYTWTFAQNFLRLNPNKKLPRDAVPTEWATSEIGEAVVIKGTFDGFNSTTLLSYLTSIGVKRLVVCGLLTSVCVLFTAQSAFANGFEVILYEPGCGDRTRERHAKTIEMYDGYVYEVVKDLDTIFPNLVPTSPNLVPTR